MKRFLCSKCEAVFDRWCPDCTYVDEAVWQERIDKGVELRRWSQQDDDVQHIIAAVCASNKVSGYGELAEQHPETFDELYETIVELLDESPSIGKLPGYMQ